MHHIKQPCEAADIFLRICKNENVFRLLGIKITIKKKKSL